MVPVMSLWLPIVLSAVIVFMASSIIHMMLGYHRTDFRKAPNEEDLQDTLRKFSIPAGDYIVRANLKGQGQARGKVSVKAGETANVELALKEGKPGGGGKKSKEKAAK